MQLVDTHCHIQSAGSAAGERLTREIWAKDPSISGEALVKRAADGDVSKLVCVGCDLDDSKLAIDFVQPYDDCFASIGIHPHEAKDYADNQAKLDEFATLATAPKVVAVGECGLDFYYNHSPKEAQIAVLRFQIELALQHGLPLIFHVRDAFDDFWPVFDSYSGIRGVLHSFTDSMPNMERAIGKGLIIGVNGIATFSKDPQQAEVYKSIPLEHLVLETDAPFLTPTPYRGTINEPKYVLTVANFLATLRGENLNSLAQATTANAHKLFGLK